MWTEQYRIVSRLHGLQVMKKVQLEEPELRVDVKQRESDADWRTHHGAKKRVAPNALIFSTCKTSSSAF